MPGKVGQAVAVERELLGGREAGQKVGGHCGEQIAAQLQLAEKRQRERGIAEQQQRGDGASVQRQRLQRRKREYLLGKRTERVVRQIETCQGAQSQSGDWPMRATWRRRGRMDRGVDRGMDRGMDWGMDWGMDRGMDRGMECTEKKRGWRGRCRWRC